MPKRPQKLSKAQLAMLQKARSQGFVLAPAGVKTAWILERAGLLERVKMWTVKRCWHNAMVSETYEYEFRLTDAGKARCTEAS